MDWWYLETREGFIVGFIWLFIWFMTMFYVTFFWINIPELDILGWQDPGLRMKPTMVEGPNSPLYISLPRSSIMPQVHGVPVGACGMCSHWVWGCEIWCTNVLTSDYSIYSGNDRIETSAQPGFRGKKFVHSDRFIYESSSFAIHK